MIMSDQDVMPPNDDEPMEPCPAKGNGMRPIPHIAQNTHPTRLKQHLDAIADDMNEVMKRLTDDQPVDLQDLRASMAWIARSVIVVCRVGVATADAAEKAGSQARTATSRAGRHW
jgi:hypothetical protein